MLFPLLLASVSTQPALASAPKSDWTVALVAHARKEWPKAFVLKPATAKVPPAPPMPGATKPVNPSSPTGDATRNPGLLYNVVVVNGPPAETREHFERRLRLFNLECEAQGQAAKARVFLKAGKTEQALRFLINLPSYGEAAYPLAPVYADCYFRLGRYADAYRALAPWVAAASAAHDEHVLVPASLAAALAGERYPGQAEYVTSLFYQGGRGGDYHQHELLPAGDTPRQLAVLSALQMYCEAEEQDEDEHGELFYDELCLKLDPGNPIASVDIALLCREHGNTPLFYEVLDAARPRAVGAIKTNWIQPMLSMEEYWKKRMKPVNPKDDLFGTPDPKPEKKLYLHLPATKSDQP